MKKLVIFVLILSLVFAFTACGSDAATDATESTAKEESAPGSTEVAEESSVKVGVILVHDENSGYDYAHIQGIETAAAAVGVSEDNIVWKYNIPEDETCYDTASDLVEQGCTLIISDSFGHQGFMQQAAEENEDVTFIAMTGVSAAPSGLANFKNAFNLTYESRYVSGVVAGMKLAELIEAGEIADSSMVDGNVKIGYVGAYPYEEVVSGYTGFFLGVRSIVENVVMDVIYTNSWYDPVAEGEAANALMSSGCVIIGQHADSTGAPSAVEDALNGGTTVYSVGYNISMLSVAPNAALTSSQNDWSAYYTYALGQAVNGEDIATDWAEGYAEGAVMISELGESCADGTAEKVAEVEAAIKDGSLHVFDITTFTVGGETVTSTPALDTDNDFVPDSGEAIVDGVFAESTLRSAPYFGLRIDGITELFE